MHAPDAPARTSIKINTNSTPAPSDHDADSLQGTDRHTIPSSSSGPSVSSGGGGGGSGGGGGGGGRGASVGGGGVAGDGGNQHHLAAVPELTENRGAVQQVWCYQHRKSIRRPAKMWHQHRHGRSGPSLADWSTGRIPG